MRVKVGDLNVKCLHYPDDAVLIASSECELQAMVTTLNEGCENNGLSLSSINTNNTKILVFERDEEKMKYKMIQCKR